MEVKQVLKKSVAFTLILALCFAMMAVFITTESYAAGKTHLKKTTITMLRGETYQQKLLTSGNKTISTGKVNWSSANSKVAKVTKTGKVTAIKVGKTTLKAKYRGKNYSFKVEVKKGVLTGPGTIMVGNPCWIVGLERKAYDDGYASEEVESNKIKFRSSNENILTFAKKGKNIWVKGVSEGKATVYATYCGVTYKKNIKVEQHTMSNFRIKSSDSGGVVFCCFDSNDDWNIKYEVLTGSSLIGSKGTWTEGNGMCFKIMLMPLKTGQIKVRAYSKYDYTISHTYVINVKNGKFAGEGTLEPLLPPTYSEAGMPDLGVYYGLPLLYQGAIDVNSMEYEYSVGNNSFTAQTICASYRDSLLDRGWKLVDVIENDRGGMMYTFYNGSYVSGLEWYEEANGNCGIHVVIVRR